MERLSEIAKSRYVVFYDELSHFNPIYAYPTETTLFPIDIEIRYHVKNLSLLCLYFDTILIMMGNILNFHNHTTKAIIQGVTNHRQFMEMVNLGLVAFGGWGGSTVPELIDNQKSYASLYRPELKDGNTFKTFSNLVSNSISVIRDDRTGEDDLIDDVLKKILFRSEILPNEQWKKVENIIHSCQEEVGYLGTLELFPRLTLLHPSIARSVHEAYFDAWIDYSARRYSPTFIYESPRITTNVSRSFSHVMGEKKDIAAILLSPPFLEYFLKKFLSDREYRSLVNLPPSEIAALRSDEWHLFQECYMKIVNACSDIYWKILMANPLHAAENPTEIMYSSLSEVIKNGDESVSIGLILDFLSALSKEYLPFPGIGVLIQFIKKTLSHRLNQEFEKRIKQKKFNEFYPFISCVRSAISANV